MKKPDYIFLFSALALSAIGLIMVFSASPTMGLKIGDSFYFIKRHILYLLLGLAAFYFGARLELASLKKQAGFIFIISLFLLILLYVPGLGQRISGATRWLNLVFISFQPSELIKFTMVLLLAKILAKDKINDLIFFLLPILCLIAAVVGIIVLQPDLGTAIVIAGASLIMLFAAGIHLKYLVTLATAGIISIIGLSLSSPYRLRRLIAFADPWKYPQGIGFQVVQSLLAVGSGGLSGLGLGASRQKFFYLPQQFTDFIFAILCEELGFVGGITVVILFSTFAIRGLKIAALATDDFSSLLATGLVSFLTIQALINIMVVLGLLPTTGIPLPFISYGGTSTIMTLFCVGILFNISLNHKKAQ